MQISLSVASDIHYYATLEQDVSSVEKILEYSDPITEKYEGLIAPRGLAY